MRSFLLFTVLLLTTSLQAQHILLIGNNAGICLDSASSLDLVRSNELVQPLEQFDAVLLFSNARSQLNDHSVDQLLTYVSNGGGLYCGADNPPLQDEFNQVTNQIFAREAWGEFSNRRAEISEKSFLKCTLEDTLDAGHTTTAIPLDARMHVEAWVEDQPLIASYHFGKGIIVFDGGYSRFYCPIAEANLKVLGAIISFLSSNHTD